MMGIAENGEKKLYDVQAVKKRLLDFRDAEFEINNQLERLDRLKTKMYSVGSQQITDMPKNPSPSNDRMANLVAKATELENGIRDFIRAHADEEKEIEQIVRKLKKSEERAVVRMRYLDFEDWSDVCFEIYGENERYDENEPNYLRRLMRIHGDALLNMAKIIIEERQ